MSLNPVKNVESKPVNVKKATRDEVRLAQVCLDILFDASHSADSVVRWSHGWRFVTLHVCPLHQSMRHGHQPTLMRFYVLS